MRPAPPSLNPMSLIPAPKSRRGLGLIALAAVSAYFVYLCILAYSGRDRAVGTLAFGLHQPLPRFESATREAAIRAGRVSPPGGVSRSCAKSVEPYKAAAIKWRRMLGSAACKAGAPVSVTGTWCLQPELARKWPKGTGTPAKHHVPADRGVGAGLAKHLGGKNYSLLDIGAGVGQYGYYLKSHNASLTWFGYDGAENVEEFTGGFVAWTDATDETLDAIPFRADWVMSLEVGEHIPPKSSDDFVKTLDRHNKLGIVLSWALPWPWQRGLYHINNMTNKQVTELMRKYGYVQNAWCLKFQKDVRRTADYSWFRNTFMVFVRETPLKEGA